MPIYEYECGACQTRVEYIQKFEEGAKRKCPECGELKLKRLMSAAAFHLKGTGWYVTDFKDKKKANGKDKEADKGEKKETKSVDKKESKSGAGKDSKASDSKTGKSGSAPSSS